MRLPPDDPHNQRGALAHVERSLRAQRAKVRWAISGLRGSLRRDRELPGHLRTKGHDDDLAWRRHVLRAQRLEYRTIFRRFLKIRVAVRALDEAALQQGAA